MGFALLGAEMAYECAELSDAAWRTHVEALIWSRQRLLDQVMPKSDLKRFAYTADPEAAAAECVLRGMWVDCGDYWRIVFYDAWQPTREAVEKRREDDRVKKDRRRRHQRGDHSLCLPGRCAGLSPGDAPGESPGDARGESPRVSREEQRSEEPQLREHIPTTDCSECQRRYIFNSGPCPRHATTETELTA